MKNLFVILLMVFSLQSFSQDQKCLSFSNDIIKDVNGKIITQYTNLSNLYEMKVEVIK
jgi:hypothetical protein